VIGTLLAEESRWITAQRRARDAHRRMSLGDRI
jgi:hypothetical protein